MSSQWDSISCGKTRFLWCCLFGPQELDLVTMRAEQQDFTAEFTLTPSSDLPQQVHSFSSVAVFRVKRQKLFCFRVCRLANKKLLTPPRGSNQAWQQHSARGLGGQPGQNMREKEQKKKTKTSICRAAGGGARPMV
jgi:hypothetical protein